jgi:hypothetical protein
MAVLPCVNPYPRVRPALAVLVVGALAGLLLAAGSGVSAAAPRPVASSHAATSPAAYALGPVDR